MPHSLHDRLTLRAAVLASVRAFFAGRAYLEVETPSLVRSPGMDLHLDAFDVCEADGTAAGFLITSPEYQLKRLVCAGFERIFEIARCFRRGEVGDRHNPEFTMLEWYRVGAGYHDLMDETEALVRAIAHAHRGGSLWVGRDLDASAPFLRMTVAEAFDRFAGMPGSAVLALAKNDEDAYFRLLVERVEPGLGGLDRPVFLHDFPATQASLARRKPEAPEWCERFELYAGDIELCNGFGELCDPVEQRARFTADQTTRVAQGRPVYPIDERFLEAMGTGMPACSGNALGLDRLVAAMAGVDAIGDVMAFPVARL